MNTEDEIIAIRIYNDVYFGQLAIDTVCETRMCHQLYSRWVFYFMAEFDLSPQWKIWADNAPTLFLYSEYREFLNAK